MPMRELPLAVLTDITRALPDEQVHTRLASLTIQDFRNYDGCRLEIDAPKVLLLGANGAGKTNLMEAISLLAPGRGLRRAKSEHLPRLSAGTPDWAVSAKVTSRGETVTLGTGVRAETDGPRRVMRRDGETVSQAEVGRLFSVSWLTPRMDGIFIDSRGAPPVLDRLVIAFDPAHTADEPLREDASRTHDASVRGARRRGLAFGDRASLANRPWP